MKSLVNLVAYIAGALLVFLAALTSADVLFRFLFKAPFEGTLEIVETAFVFVVFLGFGATFLDKREIRVDIFIGHAKGKMELALDLLSLVLSAVFFLIITWYGSLNWLQAWRIGDVGMGELRVPVVIPWAGVVLGALLVLAVIVVRIVSLVATLFASPKNEVGA